MGNGTSSSDADDYFGFRVKEIRKLSPAAKSGLISNSDYVLSANGKTLKNMESTAIAELIRVNENREVHLKVFNENTSKIRDVTIVPSKNWPGEGLLGVVLKLEKYDPHTKKTASTEDCDINLEDVYTKDNPIARRSMARQTTSPKPKPNPPKASPQASML